MSFLENDNVLTSRNIEHSSLPSYEDWFPPSCKRNSYTEADTSPAATDRTTSANSTAIKNSSCMKLIRYMTIDICNTFKKRNPCFEYDSAYNPKRVLTKPSAPVKNNGYDNENSDYILYVHGLLGSDDLEENEKKYEILDVLGAGTFGQVAKCRNTETGELVAVKVIKNKPAYTKQSLIEVDILTHLNNVSDPNEQHNILRLKESFFSKNHLCLVFELLSVNLYELIKQNHFKGLSTNLVRVFSSQILDTLSITKANQIIHCDLKPENILLKSLDSPAIKVIDFGSACQESQQTYTYIQSRFYRSPEVLLGMRYTTAIDMWSFGCIVAELYLGLPLFPGNSEYNQLTRITEAVGNIPDNMIISGKHGHRYFNRSPINTSTNDGKEQGYHYSLKAIKQYSEERKKHERASKRYFSTFNLDELVLKYPMPKKNITETEKAREMKIRSFLLDFLRKVLQVDPQKRLTPKEALKHPFISGLLDDPPQEEIEKEEEEEIISLGNEMMKKRLKEEDDDRQEDEEDVPLVLTGVRRKSFANQEARSSTSVSPFSRKRYGSILSPLLSPPMDGQDKHEKEKNQDQLTAEQIMMSQLDHNFETRLRHRHNSNHR